jgi:hypothetical protein
MKPAGQAKHFILAFLLALAGYVICYQLIEHRRAQNGPWLITFAASSDNGPVIVVNQSKLGITNVQISFADKALPGTNAPTTIAFGQPQPVPYDLPFGTCVFMDTTFLPGTVTLELFGHQIELLPRVLVIDGQEHPWRAEGQIVIRRRSAPTAPSPP